MKRIKNAVFNMIGLGQKDEPSKEIKSVVILFNKVNHTSILAATFCERIYLERVPDVKVTLVDIRDMVPEDADRYIWVECGGPKSYVTYFMPGGKAPVTLIEASVKALLRHLLENSVVIEPIVRQDRQIEETTLGRMFFHLFEEGLAAMEDRTLFAKYAMLSEEYLGEKMDDISAAGYTTALTWAYNNYNGYPVTLKTMEVLLSPSQEEAMAFKEKQRLLNRALTSRFKVIHVGNRVVYQLTATGPEIYGLMRRIALARKEFLHISTGCFGTIYYASIPMPEPSQSSIGGILDLTPTVELMTAAGTWKATTPVAA